MFRMGQDVWHGRAVLLPVPDDPSKVLLVTYAPQGLGTQPRMLLRLGWRFQPNPASPADFRDGLPPVLCILFADQAESLMQHGVPETLLDAMLDGSKSAGWPASLPATGILSTSGDPDPVVVQPDPHF